MKVKISYSVDLEEVPDRAKCLLYEIEKELSEASDNVPGFTRQDLYGDEYTKFKTLIDKVRKKLFIVDSKMEDVMLILDDWKKAKLAMEVETMTLANENHKVARNDKDSE